MLHEWMHFRRNVPFLEFSQRTEADSTHQKKSDAPPSENLAALDVERTSHLTREIEIVPNWKYESHPHYQFPFSL